MLDLPASVRADTSADGSQQAEEGICVLTDLWDAMERRIIPLLLNYRVEIGRLKVETKADRTLLTDADVAIQDEMVQLVRDFAPGARIIAEEVSNVVGGRAEYDQVGDLWVIDPIDGTSQFVDPAAIEYCSVACLVSDGVPVAAIVLAPELGKQGSALSIRVDGIGAPITVNHTPAAAVAEDVTNASVTRSRGTPPSRVEALLADREWRLKTQTTSQTLDMIRTAVDLTSHTADAHGRFALFYRERQKLWDGVAGICMARAAGLIITNGLGLPQETVNVVMFDGDPVIESTLVASERLLGALFPLDAAGMAASDRDGTP